MTKDYKQEQTESLDCIFRQIQEKIIFHLLKLKVTRCHQQAVGWLVVIGDITWCTISHHSGLRRLISVSFGINSNNYPKACWNDTQHDLLCWHINQTLKHTVSE